VKEKIFVTVQLRGVRRQGDTQTDEVDFWPKSRLCQRERDRGR
jgi:hypothetical protein